MSEKTNAEKFALANKWLHLQNKDISILQSLQDRGITKIIVYGASEFALRLIEQCEKKSELVKIIAISDKKITSKGTYYKDIPLVSINDIKEIDMSSACVVITAMGFYEEIKKDLYEKGITNVTSLRELIYDVYCQL